MASTERGEGGAEETSYSLKRIQWNGEATGIVLQSESGPCPLIALANALALRRDERFATSGSILQSDLLERVGNHLSQAASHSGDQNWAQNVDDALGVLPRLTRGLDVNVRFNGVDQVEFTPELAPFDVLHVRVLHGWVIDPEDAVTQSVRHSRRRSPLNSTSVIIAFLAFAQAVGTKSYNQLVERIVGAMDARERAHVRVNIRAHDGDDGKCARATVAECQGTSAEADEQGEAAAISEFLASTSGQLTAEGLSQLHTSVNEGEIFAFFRNNHFSTAIKRDNRLFLLVTDVGYQHESDVVWEELAAIDGDTRLCRADFTPFKANSEHPQWHLLNEGAEGDPAIPADTASDYEIAVRMQQQEEHALQRQRERQHEERRRRQEQSARERASRQRQDKSPCSVM